MKIDKNALKALASLSDGELWSTVVKLAGSHGYKISETTPPPEQMAQIRALLTDSDKIGMRDALRLLNSYKKK